MSQCPHANHFVYSRPSEGARDSLGVALRELMKHG